MTSSGLIVRRTERFEISLPAKVRVAMQHLDSVQFVKGVTDPDRWINVDVVDFAQGGIGFVSDIFFARGLELELEIMDIGAVEGDSLIQCTLQIKRVQMTDRRPAYLVGCAFNGVDDDTKSAIESLINRLSGMMDDQDNDGGHDA
jgi:PilZ domain